MKPFKFLYLLVVSILVGCQLQSPTSYMEAPNSPTPTTAQALSEGPIHILFLGNSYTESFFSIPKGFSELALSGGHSVEVAVFAPGGWTMRQHTDSKETAELLLSRRWDIVVLQENGHIASKKDTCIDEMLLPVNLILQQIPSDDTKPVLFMQWGCRDGTIACNQQDFDNAQTELQFCYENIANEVGGLVAPVGTAWRHAVSQYPALELWYVDGIHASELGAYLGACVFYALLFQESPEGLSYTANLSIEEAFILQSIAADTVLGDP